MFFPPTFKIETAHQEPSRFSRLPIPALLKGTSSLPAPRFQKSACDSHSLFTVHCTSSKHGAPVHQMQYYIPAPPSPSKTLWCHIDTLVNSTSWIWYCLATAEKNLLLVASSGWGGRGCKRGWFGWRRRGRRGRMLDGINHNGAAWWRSAFGFPPGTGAKLKPRKSDYGVPRGGMPSSQLMSAHLLLAVLCTAKPRCWLRGQFVNNYCSLVKLPARERGLHGGDNSQGLLSCNYRSLSEGSGWWIVSEVWGFADCQFAVKTPIINDTCSACWVIDMQSFVFLLHCATFHHLMTVALQWRGQLTVCVLKKWQCCHDVDMCFFDCTNRGKKDDVITFFAIFITKTQKSRKIWEKVTIEKIKVAFSSNWLIRYSSSFNEC